MQNVQGKREFVANALKIRQLPPRQDSLDDQLRDLHIIAARIGCYDAADWLWKAGIEPRDLR